MTSAEKVLTEFGLSANEIKVYLACLLENDLTPFKLAQITKIPRSTVYNILLALSFKGLIDLEQSDGFQKQQTKIKAKDPHTLRKIIHAKRKKLLELDADVVQILPGLKKSFLNNIPSQDFEFYPGVEGMKKVYLEESNFEIESESLSYENLMPVDVLTRKEINEDIKDSTTRRQKNRSTRKELICLNDWSKYVLTYQYDRDPNYIADREYRYIESPVFDIKARIVIIGNHTRISCAHENEVWGLIINSPALASTLKGIFYTIWPIGRAVTKELVESWGKNELFELEHKKYGVT